LNTPVLLLIFNRPDTTAKVFAEIRKKKPKYLYIAADGPRENNPTDLELCKETRNIISKIDWDCKLKTLFNNKNLGCSLAPATGITWFFKHEESGVILEDDCIPSSSFFYLCEELLHKYKDDYNIMHITGANLNDDVKYGDGSYYYSKYANVWGWATWRRAWNKFELQITNSDEYFKLINRIFKYKSERLFWMSRIQLIQANHIAAWDYQWMFSIWKENGLCLNSNYNLVENIGFGTGATHTKGTSPYKSPKTKTIKSINHPSRTNIINKAETSFIYLLHGLKRQNSLEMFLTRHLIQRVINLIHKINLIVKKNAR